MAVRITQQIAIQQLLTQSAKSSADIAKLQQQITSGQRITLPSDDPLGIKTIISRSSIVSQYQTQTQSLNEASDRLNQSNSELQSVSTLLVQARDIASQARSSLDDSELTGYANQVDSILTQIRNSANSQFDGQYLFSGDTSNTQPYASSGSDYSYQGSNQNLKVSLFGKNNLDVLYSGNAVFGSANRGATTVIGTTGAKAGAGTDTSTVNSQLIVSHTLTTFASGSGVAAGTSSAAGDTIIGASGTHTLTINDTSGNGSAGTISLNGGPPVAYDSSQTNLKVQGPNGEVVYLDTTAMTPGFNGTVDLTATGTLSADGGATSVPIDFTGSQAVTTADGKVTYIDSSGVKGTGSDEVEFAGVSSVFQALADLRDEILNKRGLSGSEWQDALTRRVDEITRQQTHVLDVVGSQSQTLKSINDISDRVGELTLDAKQRLSDVASTDLTSAAVDLQEAKNQQQYGYAVMSQMFSTSLLNYLA